VPARFCKGSEVRLPAGVELPVERKGEGPDEIEVDWSEFAKGREGRKELKRHAARETNDRIVEGLERDNPEQQAMLRQVNTDSLRTWVPAVKAGSMKRKDFDQSVATLLRLRQIDPDAVEAARRELDGG
jgi:hypothetical protein